MGTDIHGVFQRQNPETKAWEDIPHNFRMERHYQLFAVLADVRNGTGFAGVKTGERVTPIAEPRGYPEDFVHACFCPDHGEVCDDRHPITTIEVIDPRRREYYEDPRPMNIWMGDHSHSWLTADEMLAWLAAAPIVTKTGIIERSQYEAWDGESAPSDWCGGIWGANIVVVHDNKVERDTHPNWTHIHIEWPSNLQQELAYFFDEVKRLKDEHGTVRFVFGFDS